MEPSEGERRAVVGFSGQYRLAAEIVYRGLSELDWIRVADPSVGVADDFQFKSGSIRHALQVKWSQYPGMFGWADLMSAAGESPALLTSLATAWSRIRKTWDGPLLVHLCSNDIATPNVSTAADNPLKSATSSAPKHFAAFLEVAWRPVRNALLTQPMDLEAIRQLPAYSEWSDAWESLRATTALSDEDFVWFLAELDIELGMSTVPPLADANRERDINDLAQGIQGFVIDPSRPMQVTRSALIDELGWQDRLQYRHRHQFPVPATYVTNQAAKDAIETLLGEVEGGYLAVVGPAGCGKSTLLSDMSFRGRVIRYYAFVPNSPDPLSGRGEAEAFLNDLSLALQESGVGRPTLPVGLQNLRLAFQSQLATAADIWKARRERTLIVIDGLDHVPREQHPYRSMLEELPGPAALQDGVYVVLATQTTSILPDPIRSLLSRDANRVVEVPPLTDNEVRNLVKKSSADLVIDTEFLDQVVATSGGHPLALTYTTQELLRVSEEFPDDREARRQGFAEILADAARFGGDINERYHGYFKAVDDDPDVTELLGSVARLRTSVRIDWLATWASASAVSKFVAKATPFFWRDGDEWTFIHNSFRRFLLDETAKVGGLPEVERDRALHLHLADRCAESDGEWAIYRDEEMAHRFLAQQYEEVVEISTPERLRTAIGDLRAMPNVIDHASLALRASAKTGNKEAFVSLFILLGELHQRTQVLNFEQLASAMVRILPPRIAIDYVVRGGKLQIAASDALRHAAMWATSGQVEVASAVINAVHGLPGILATDSRSNEAIELVENWTEATFGTSGLETVLAQIDRHLPLKHIEAETLSEDDSELWQASSDDDQYQALQCRLAALMRCFDLLLEIRDESNLARVVTILDSEAPEDWRAYVRIERAAEALRDGFDEKAAQWIDEVVQIDETVRAARSEPGSADSHSKAPLVRTSTDETTAEEGRLPLTLRLDAALVLVQTGRANDAMLEQIVPWDEQPPLVGDIHRNFWESQKDRRRHLLLSRLRRQIRQREGCDTPYTYVEPVSTKSDPGGRRFELATQALVDMQAAYLTYKLGLSPDHPYIAGMADPILRLHEVPSELTQNWSGWYRIRESVPQMMEGLISLAHRAGGTIELTKLAAKFDDAWTTERGRYWSPELRQRVLAAYASTDQASYDWIRGWLSEIRSDLSSSVFEPSHLVEIWLKNAEISAQIGLLEQARQDVVNATAAAVRIGYSDDEHQLAHWLTWLTDALHAKRISEDEFLNSAETFASRARGVASVNREAAASAAEELISRVWQVSPRKSVQIGETLCESGVIEEAQMIQAAVLAAFQDAGCPLEMPVRVATKLLLPIAKYPSSDLRAALIARNEPNQLEAFDAALDVWTIDGPLAEGLARSTTNQSPQQEADASDTTNAGDAKNVESEQVPCPGESMTPQALLANLRQLDAAQSLPEHWWAAPCSGTLRRSMSNAVAKSLLQESERLQAPDDVIGLLAQRVADLGDVDVAVKSLQSRLSRLPAYGWFRHYDGGSRQKIFRAALGTRNPELVRLATEDLAQAITSERVYWHSFSSDTKRLLELAAGAEAVSAAWPTVEAYLDIYAPTSGEILLAPAGDSCSSLPDSGSAALGFLCGNLLGHPTMAVETGARRVLLQALSFDEVTASAILHDAMHGSDWQAEAALQTIAAETRELSLNGVIVEEIQRFAVCNDAVLRDLARIIASQNGFECDDPPPRELPIGYKIFLPPKLPKRRPPELNREGTPFVDMTDPQQVIAPYDFAMRVVAQRLDLDPAAVLYRASELALRRHGDRWTDDGVKGMSNRLKRRGQMHSYRPWAYMVGRRAAGQVLAELRDAFVDDLGREVALSMGMVAPQLLHVEPDALRQDDPGPWRPPDLKWSSTTSWCDEISSAAAVYVTAIENRSDAYVLAEYSEWRSLEWGTPEEVREVATIHGIPPSQLDLLVDLEAWEYVRSGSRYPLVPYRWTDFSSWSAVSKGSLTHHIYIGGHCIPRSRVHSDGNPTPKHCSGGQAPMAPSEQDQNILYTV
ncbi:ATP-binding protein [Mycolicibacterium chlorophenolicum]|uniref:NACHT domain protein n=1 Tax=Mycolicibacterium chlorophenolicum TaxID=37916 RepID=A0A0J6Y3Y2_9MYCO|nr:ATP-binding protein [Mycolicibacterium chlorophenolicum]KMO67841.1 NACHT domain protein [Mycolicibacterium chlorophenolicum]